MLCPPNLSLPAMVPSLLEHVVGRGHVPKRMQAVAVQWREIPVGCGAWQATVTAAGQSCKKVLAVSAVIMGCTRLKGWEKLVELLSGKGVACAPGDFRAAARNAMVAEEAWKPSKQNGVEIIPTEWCADRSSTVSSPSPRV